MPTRLYRSQPHSTERAAVVDARAFTVLAARCDLFGVPATDEAPLMPEILHRCVEHVMGQGPDESSAYAICRSALDLKEGATEIDEDEMKKRADNEMAKRNLYNGPTYTKSMVVCTPFGEYVNGEQEGIMSKRRLAALAANFEKY